jgi:hypothetical protein
MAATCAADTIEIDRNSVAAIAYSPATGKFGYAYDLRSRSAAEKAALADCGADDARIVCWVKGGFCILALGDDKACWGVGWQYGSTAGTDKPRKMALDDCGNRTTNPHVVLILSSDGQRQDDARKATVITTITDSSGKTYTVTGSPGEEAAPVASPSPPPKAKEESGSMLDEVLKAKDASGGDKK